MHGMGFSSFRDGAFQVYSVNAMQRKGTKAWLFVDLADMKLYPE